jgi:hypothetical protein
VLKESTVEFITISSSFIGNRCYFMSAKPDGGISEALVSNTCGKPLQFISAPGT